MFAFVFLASTRTGCKGIRYKRGTLTTIGSRGDNESPTQHAEEVFVVCINLCKP
jgi:hypothetical protein